LGVGTNQQTPRRVGGQLATRNLLSFLIESEMFSKDKKYI